MMKRIIIAIILTAGVISSASCYSEHLKRDIIPPDDPKSQTDSALNDISNRTAGETPSVRYVGYRETTEPTDADSSCVSLTTSAFPVNHDLLTDGNRQYVLFYDQHHQMTIAQRELPTGPWRYCAIDESVKWDGHCYLTLLKDARGCILATGAMHDDPLVFFTTDESGDISTLQRIYPMIKAEDENSVTYPEFLWLKDGGLIFHYRNGNSGNGKEIYNMQNPDGSWSRFLDKPLIDGTVDTKEDQSAYMVGPTLGTDGNYHLVWVWRRTYNAETSHDLSYAYSPDLKNWYNAKGKKATLPITLKTYKDYVVDPVPEMGGISNAGLSIGFDAKKRPVIGYFKFDGQPLHIASPGYVDGYTQVYVARLEDDKTWKIQQVTNRDVRWEFKGGGIMVKEFTIGSPVLEPDTKMTIIYNTYNSKGVKLDGREAWMNGSDLSVIIPDAAPRSSQKNYPAWAKQVQIKNYTGQGTLSAHIIESGGDGGYIIRWDSLQSNRDVKPDVEIPEPSRLMVVKMLDE